MRALAPRWAVAGGAVAVGAAIVGLALTTPAVQQWALQHVPGVRVSGAQGQLWQAFEADAIEVDLPRGGLARLEGVRWQGLRLQWAPQAAWRVGVHLDSLQASRLSLRWVANPQPSTGAPQDVASPVAVAVDELQVGEARSPWWGSEVLRGVRARVVVQGAPAAAVGATGLAVPVHAVVLHSLAVRDWALQGQLALGTRGGLPLKADLRAASQAASQVASLAQPMPPKTGPGGAQASGHGKADGQAAPLQLRVQAHVSGRLSDMAVQLKLTEQDDAPASGTPAAARTMALDAQAQVQLFEAWPLAALTVQAQRIDAHRLWPDAPPTDLSGELKVAPEGARGLLSTWRLRNAQSGAWSAGRLPVSHTHGQMRWSEARQGPSVTAQPWAQGTIEASVEGPLAQAAAGRQSARAAGGKLQLVGGWGAQQALSLSWRQLWLPAWDERAPPMQWAQGALKLTPQWVRQASSAPGSPWQARTGRWQLQSQGQVMGLGGAHSLPGGRVQPMAVDGQGDWAWHMPAPAPGSGAADGSARGQLSLGVQRLALQAEPASALWRDGRVVWAQDRLSALQGTLTLARFDPALWLPWPQGMAGRNSVSGQVQAQLDAWAQGDLQVDLAPSELAGVPVQGLLHWHTAAASAQLQAKVDAAGNTLDAQASWPRRAQQPAWPHDDASWAGTQAQWALHAQALPSLRPILPILGLNDLQGRLNLRGRVQGLWPNLATSGQWQAEGLKVVPVHGPLVQLGQAQGSWLWDGRHLDAPASVEAQLSDAEVLGWKASKVVARLQGQLRAHQLEIDVQASTPAGKGSWAQQPVSLRVRADGQWQGQVSGWTSEAGFKSPGSALATWVGRLSQVHAQIGQEGGAGVAPPGGSAVRRAPAVALDVSPTTARWQRDARGSTWVVSPTDLTLGGLDLHLERWAWRQAPASNAAAPSEDQLQVQAQLRAFDLSAALQKWQPDAGWGGNLVLGGVLNLRRDAAGAWQAQAELGRQQGDLSLREPTIQGSRAQALGIRESRIALQVAQGDWRLSQRFDGALLGRFEGEQRVHLSDPSAIPTLADVLSGKLLLSAPNLRPWGTWMPAGWRLTGAAQAEATLGGTLGAPTYQGQVSGRRLGISNTLMGVQLQDGELDVRLAGDQVTLERLVAQSVGQGRLSATGEARLAEPARAVLKVEAQRLAVLQRVDRKLVLSGQTTLQLGQDDLALDGKLNVDEGLFDISRTDAPTIGDDVNVLGRDDAAADDAGSKATPRKMAVKVDIDLGQQLRIQGRGLEATLTGLLRAGTQNNKPTLNGTVAVVKGRYAAYGQKLVVSRSTVVFNGVVDNPRLDILALRQQSGGATDQDVKVGVSITGSAQDPRIRLWSDPEMSETEKLSWLVLGRAPSGLGTADIGLLQSAAVALLSGEGPSTSDNLITSLGLDELSVRQNETSSARDTVVNVGKQVSRHWFVGYERNLNATAGNWQLVYKLAQRFMLRLQTGDDNAADLIWSWRWD